MNLRDFPLREPESGGRCARGDKVGAARRSGGAQIPQGRRPYGMR